MINKHSKSIACFSHGEVTKRKLNIKELKSKENISKIKKTEEFVSDFRYSETGNSLPIDSEYVKSH